MEKIRYKLKDRYDYTKYRTDRSKDEAYNEKVTVPGQSISIKELMDRYEKGRPIPGGMYEEPGELGELKSARFEDADFQEDMRVDPLTGKEAIEKEMNSIENARKERTDKMKTDKIEADKKAKLEAENAKNESLKTPPQTPE